MIVVAGGPRRGEGGKGEGNITYICMEFGKIHVILAGKLQRGATGGGRPCAQSGLRFESHLHRVPRFPD